MRIAVITTDGRYAVPRAAGTTPEFGTAPQALLQGLAGLPEAEVHVLSCTRGPLVAPAKLADNIFFHSLVVPKIGWLRTGYQGCLRAVRRTLRRLGPDIVHGQGTERECALSAVFSGYPNVVTIHGNMAELYRQFGAETGLYGWCAARLESVALRRTDGVFCNSAYTEDLVRPRTARTWRVANALREEFFRPAPSPGAPARGTLVNVGVVSPRKRQLELLELARSLRQRGREFTLLFVGPADPANPYAARFLERIRAVAPQGWARHLGCLDSGQLIECFDQAAALLHFPSEEAFGLVVAEALARNLKVFATRAGGIVEIAAGIPAAALFAADDWRGLAAALEDWLGAGSPPPSPAAPRIRERYHPTVIARRHLEIYQEVLAGQTGR